MWPIKVGRFVKLLLLNDFRIIFTLIFINIIYCLISSVDTISLLGSNHRGTFLNLLSLSLNYPTLSSCFFLLMFSYFVILTDKFPNFFLILLKTNALLTPLNIYYVFYSKISHWNFVEVTNFLLANGLNEVHPPLLYLSVACILVNTLLLYTYNLTWTFFSKLYFINFIKSIYSLKMTFTALFLGSWWAFQESSWSGWWAWEISETLLLYLYAVTLMFFHVRFTISVSKIVLTQWLFICGLYILKYIIIVETVGTLHTFFTGGLLPLQDFTIFKFIFVLIISATIFILITQGTMIGATRLNSTIWSYYWCYLITVLLIWTYLFSFYNLFNNCKPVLLIFIVIIAILPLPEVRRVDFFLKIKNHSAAILFLTAQILYFNLPLTTAFYNVYYFELNSLLGFGVDAFNEYNIYRKTISSYPLQEGTFIFKLTISVVYDFMHSINYAQKNLSVQSTLIEDLLHPLFFYFFL